MKTLFVLLVVAALASTPASGDAVKKVDAAPTAASNLTTEHVTNATELDAPENKTDTKWIKFPGYLFKSVTVNLQKKEVDSADLANITEKLDELWKKVEKLEKIEAFINAHDALDGGPNKRNKANAVRSIQNGLILILPLLIGAAF